MAARRLLAVLIVLLVVSTAVALLAPSPTRRNEATTTAAPPPAKGPTETVAAPSAGKSVDGLIRTDAPRPPQVEVSPGDQLRLAVAGPEGTDVEIPRLGLTGTLTPFAPAVFYIYLDRQGRFPVRQVPSGKLLGTIVSRREEPSVGGGNGASARQTESPRAG
ncbi:MAG: hypothetical protein U0R52_01780 [Solirubrobacterales bacterium]